MDKPRKRPITISQLANLTIIVIETLTKQAEEWTQTHAKEFGRLTKDPIRNTEWMLFVYDGYDCTEVINYLRDLWDSQSWPENVTD